MVEIVIALVMLSVVAGLAIQKLNLSQYRSDGAAQQVRSVFQTAQRTSLTRQYDVIVSIDTVLNQLRIAEDVNNDGTIQSTEWKFARSLGDNNFLMTPPKGVNSTTVASPIVGASLKMISGSPSVVFHRDGSASSDAEVYIGSVYRNRTDFRAVLLTRATGRSEMYRLSGTGTSAIWQVAQ